ncbi:MAG: tyrosine-type recombinase/integrase [Chloroflexi bacterium]|nr:tyrosine-type recombinase/integrase [Chloroflexota bacterium]
MYEGRDDSGRKRYRSRTVRGTRRDAQRVASNLHLEVELGVAASGGRASLAEYLRSRWLPHVRLHRRPSTYARYSGIVARCIAADLGRLPLRRVSAVDVQGLCDRALAQGFAPARVHLIHAVVQKALAQAVTWQLVPRNAATHVELARIPQRAIAVLDRTAVRRLFQTNESQPVYPLLVLAVLGGLRRGELLGLRWADVDFDRECVIVRRSLAPVRGRGLVLGPTKTHHERRVDLGALGLEALREQWTRQVAQQRRDADAEPAGCLVFANAAGRPLQFSTVHRWVKAAFKRAGLPPETRLHDLRHTHASLLLARGHALPVVSERLGHRTKSTTANLYAHALPTSQRAATQDLDAYLAGPEMTPGRHRSWSTPIPPVVRQPGGMEGGVRLQPASGSSSLRCP